MNDIIDSIDKDKVPACPEDCVFDWEDFHKKFDVAFAHMITEYNDLNQYPALPLLPSRTTMMAFLEYSHAKVLRQREKKNEQN